MRIISSFFILLTSLICSQDYQNNFKNLIANTTWCVPPSTLLAYQYSPTSYTSVTDQTVWVIDSYDGGYFFGTSYTAIVNPPDPINYTEKKIIGTVTDGGAVYITFIPSGTVGATDLVSGIGTFVSLQGSYRFVMQTNAGSTTNGLSHWSYMVSINESSPYYSNLPGVNQSLPYFLTHNF